MNNFLKASLHVAAAVLDASAQEHSRRQPVRERTARSTPRYRSTTVRREEPTSVLERWAIKIDDETVITTVIEGKVVDVNTDDSFFGRSREKDFIKAYETNYATFKNTEAAIMKSAKKLAAFHFAEITYSKLN